MNFLKKILLLASVSMMALSCQRILTEEFGADELSEGAIGFSAYTSVPVTKGEIVTKDTVQSMGIGVFAFYQEAVSEQPVPFNTHKFSTPGFMYNQQVEDSDKDGKWTYTPLKYWPNNVGDRLSFFACAPFSESCRWEDLNVSTSSNADRLYVTFDINDDLTLQKDLLWATPRINQTNKLSGNVNNTARTVSFTFRHITSKVDLAIGVVTPGSSSASEWTDTNTVILPKSVTFTGLGSRLKYTYTIQNDTLVEPATAECVEGMTYDLSIAPCAAADTIGESNWGIPGGSAHKKGLFTSGSELYYKYLPTNQFLFLCPQSFGDQTVSITYSVKTTDAADSRNSSTITNTITKSLSSVFPGGAVESGQAYCLKFLIGLDDVNINATVEEWGSAAYEKEVGVPENYYGITVTSKTSNWNVSSVSSTGSGRATQAGDTLSFTVTKAGSDTAFFCTVTPGANSLASGSIPAVSASMEAGKLYRTVSGDVTTIKYIVPSSNPAESIVIGDIVATTVQDIAGANEYVSNNRTEKEINVTFTRQPNDAGVPGQGGSNAIVTSLLAQDAMYNVKVGSTTNILYVGDYDYTDDGGQTTYDYDTILSSTSGKTNAAGVNLIIPDSLYIGTLVINSPSKSVYVNGEIISGTNAYHINNLIVNEVSMSTVVIENGMKVDTLTMIKGGLEIHNTDSTEVKLLIINPENEADVRVRKCENLNQDVFNAIKSGDHNYIDRPAFAEKQNTDGTWDIVPSVCKIDEVGYATIYDAVTAAQDNETIELLKDITLTDWVLINKSVNINLNGYTVTGSDTGGTTHTDYCFTYAADNSSSRIKGMVYNGTINSKKVGVYAADYSDITVKDLTITQTTSTGLALSFPHSALAASDDATLLVKNGAYSADYAAAYVFNSGAYITIESGTFSANLSSNSYSIRVDGTQYNQTSFESVAELKGGCFNGPMLLAQNEAPSEYAAILAKGGVYSLDPTAYVADGYFAKQEGDTWTVVGEYVARIDDTGYESLAAAFEAVQVGETITVLKNCETGGDYTKEAPLVLDKACVTLDLNGKEVTETNNFSLTMAADSIVVKNGKITSGTNSAKTCGYHSYAIVVGAIAQGEKVKGVEINNVTFKGGISIGGSTNNDTAKCMGSAEATIENCTVTSGDFDVIYAQPANSVVTVLSGNYTKMYSSTMGTEGDGSYIYLKGGTYNFDPNTWLAPGYTATENSGIWTVTWE